MLADKVSGVRLKERAMGKALALAKTSRGQKLILKTIKATCQARSNPRQLGLSLPETGYNLRQVTIYRAVPAHVSSFYPNDYVGRKLQWVKGHADHTAAVTEEEAVVLKLRVLASDVYEAYNPGEYFYAGPEAEGRVVYRKKY